MVAGHVTTNVAAWDSQIVGPVAYAVARTIRSLGSLGRPIEPGELVTIDAVDPFTLQLPDPRRSPGKSIAVTYVGGEEPVTWQAFPGTLVSGAATWVASVGPEGGYVFSSIGTQWRVIAHFNGV
jgi:hypothetical protein